MRHRSARPFRWWRLLAQPPKIRVSPFHCFEGFPHDFWRIDRNRLHPRQQRCLTHAAAHWRPARNFSWRKTGGHCARGGGQTRQAGLCRGGGVWRGRVGPAQRRRLCGGRRQHRAHRRRAVERQRHCFQSARAHTRRSGADARGPDADRLPLASAKPRFDAAAGSQKSHRAVHRRAAAHAQPRTEDGRPDLDGGRQRLPRSDRSGQRIWPLLQRPNHSGGQSAPSQGVHCRGRCGRSGRHWRGLQPGRHRARQRHAR